MRKFAEYTVYFRADLLILHLRMSWEQGQAGSTPVIPTRKSLWSSTPHRDFSIECYKVAKKTPDGIDYEITIDVKNGYATVAMTKYYDETEEPTLPINLGTHSIYFYAE